MKLTTQILSFKISILQIMNTHLKESFLSRTTQSLAWQVKVERSEVFMGGFGKNFPLERFVEFLREYHKFITCLPTIIKFQKRWGGTKIITIFFLIIINLKWCYFFLLFILNLVNRLYYMEIKSNNSNYRQISTKLIIVGTLLKFST